MRRCLSKYRRNRLLQFTMRSTNTEKLLWNGVEKRFPNRLGGAVSGEGITRSAYASGADGKERCLYFDAIETMDHIKLWREARK